MPSMSKEILEAVESRKRSVGSPLKVWKLPEHGKSYILAADPCLGNGPDNAAIQVIDAETGEQCAEFAQIVSPEELAPIIIDIARKYNSAEVAVEVNSFGMVTNSLLLRKFGYENLYCYKRLDRLKDVVTDISGWWTDYKTKIRMESTFRDVIGHNPRLIVSAELLDEILEYDENGSAADDRLVAMMIALSVRNERMLVAAE